MHTARWSTLVPALGVVALALGGSGCAPPEPSDPAAAAESVEAVHQPIIGGRPPPAASGQRRSGR